MPNFSSLANLEVPEKFVGGGWGGGWGGGFQVSTVSNPTKLLLSCVKLSWVELSYVGFWQYSDETYLHRDQNAHHALNVPLFQLTTSSSRSSANAKDAIVWSLAGTTPNLFIPPPDILLRQHALLSHFASIVWFSNPSITIERSEVWVQKSLLVWQENSVLQKFGFGLLYCSQPITGQSVNCQ